MIINVENSFNTKNYYIDRLKDYNPIGRLHSVEESNNIANRIKKLLNDYKINYITIFSNVEGYDSIVRDILIELNGGQNK